MIAYTIAKHHARLREGRCLISGRTNPTLHHVHGGSIRAHGITRGKSQKTSDWLVIPIDAMYHVGDYGIDGALTVGEWERLFGTQLWHLTEVCRLYGHDVFALAGYHHPGMVPAFPVD